MITKRVQVHKPAPSLHLPAHERAAAARRRHNVALPGIPSPGTRKPRAADPRPVPTHLVSHPVGYR